jgi:hypothetical protein
MGADHEHDEPEPDFGKEGERGVGGVQVTEARPAQDDPHEELPDDHRYVPTPRKSEKGPDQAGQDDDRQH